MDSQGSAATVREIFERASRHDLAAGLGSADGPQAACATSTLDRIGDENVYGNVDHTVAAQITAEEVAVTDL